MTVILLVQIVVTRKVTHNMLSTYTFLVDFKFHENYELSCNKSCNTKPNTRFIYIQGEHKAFP